MIVVVAIGSGTRTVPGSISTTSSRNDPTMKPTPSINTAINAPIANTPVSRRRNRHPIPNRASSAAMTSS